MAWLKQIALILAWDDTRPVRFFIGLLDFVFAWYLTTTVSHDDAALMSKALGAANATAVWIALFVAHGIFILRGLGGKFGFFTLMTEGVLGLFIWGITAITHAMAQGSLGPSAIAALMMVWLVARHPLDFGGKKGDRRHG